MNRRISNLAFISGCTAAFAVWAVCWPAKPSPARPVADAPATKKPRWDPALLPEILRSLEQATTRDERLTAAARLQEIPTSGIPEALEQVKLQDGKKLSFAARALLIRWAASDGGAALGWAWTRFKQGPLLTSAFSEIGSSWAWHHPDAMAAWAIQAISPGLHTPEKIAESNAGHVFIPDSGQVVQICEWLAPTHPDLAYQVLVARSGWSSEDTKIADKLQTPAQFHQALLAFGDLKGMKPNVYRGNEMQAAMLMERWRAIDPEGFAGSRYAALIAPPGGNVLPVGNRDTAVGNFITWSRDPHGNRPDMTGWPESKKQAWSDLEALGAPQR